MPELRFSLRDEFRDLRQVGDEARRTERTARGALAFSGRRFDAVEASRRMREVGKEVRAFNLDASAALRTYATIQSLKTIVSGQADPLSVAWLTHEGASLMTRYAVRGGWSRLGAVVTRTVGAAAGPAAGLLVGAALAAESYQFIRKKEEEAEAYFEARRSREQDPLLKGLDSLITRAASKQRAPTLDMSVKMVAEKRVAEGMRAFAEQPELYASIMKVDTTDLARRGALEAGVDFFTLSRSQRKQALARGIVMSLVDTSDLSALEIGEGLREGKIPTFDMGGKFTGMVTPTKFIAGEFKSRDMIAAEERTQHAIERDRHTRAAIAKAYD